MLSMAFVIDPLERLNPAHDTSVALIEQAQAAGHRVDVTEMSDLGIRHGRTTAFCRDLTVRPAELSGGHWTAAPDWCTPGARHQRYLDEFDVVFVRTDPPVDEHYIRGTFALDLLEQTSTLVVNSARGLRNANEKLFALRFPDLCPPTVVTSDAGEILEAVSGWSTAVLKPTDGMAGRGVMLLRDGDPNVRSIIDTATVRGRCQVVVQRYLPESAQGDRRVIVLDGQPIGSVRRLAAPGEFRCNMAAGASVVADVVAPRDHEICKRIADDLDEFGLYFVGIDVIGDHLIEVNVTSPTGLREIDALSGGNLAGQVIRGAERRAALLRA
jgi:glutathione synthase